MIRSIFTRFALRVGFTLIEILVVTVIVGLMATLLLPRFPDLTEARLNQTARKLSNIIQYTFDQAHSGGETFMLKLNRAEGSYSLWRLNAKREFEPSDSPFARAAKFPDGIKMASAFTFSQGEIPADEARIFFTPGGLVDFAIIRLEDSAGRRKSVKVNPLMGSSEILDGFHYESARAD